MNEKEIKKYMDFMLNKKNEYACVKCPENRGCHSTIERKLPCGQQNCWVTCHVRQING